MRRFYKLLVAVAVLPLVLILTACPAAPQESEEQQESSLAQGYYVIFNFQFKPADNPDLGEGEILVNPALKMTEEGGEYILKIKKKDLAPVIEGHDKNGVYWWNVVYVSDPNDPSKWIVYGGTCDYCPSVPFLKEDFDKLEEDDTVEFYAQIPDSTDTIVGLGDNLKDGRDFYFAGSPNSWTHQKMEYKGNGIYEITLEGYIKDFEYKIWPADSWDISDTLKALAFNGVNFYATGPNGKFSLEKYSKIKVVFDAHHSMVTVEPIEEIPTIGEIKERILSNPEEEFATKAIGVVTYIRNGYWLTFQDETDGIKLYDPEGRLDSIETLEEGAMIFVEGSAMDYTKYADEPEIVLSTLTILSTGNSYEPFDITGVEPSSRTYGQFVTFTGKLGEFDRYGNAIFDSEGATIVVSDYYSGDIDWVVGAEYIVRGIVSYYYGYKVYPRVKDDVLLKTEINVDGDLSDWPEDALTIEDATNDSKWGEDNDFNFLKIHNDDTYLYVAGKVLVSNNGFLVVFDADQDLQGATDLSAMNAWARQIRLEGFENEFFVAGGNWGDPFVQVWRMKNSTETENVSSKAFAVYNGEYFELAIPWNTVASNKPSQLKVAAFVVGGDGSSAPDTIPDITYPDGWDWNVPITVATYVVYEVR